MRSQYVPLTLENVEEGGFLRDANEHFALAQAAVTAFVRKHGLEAAGKAAKAKVLLELEIQAKDDTSYAVTTKVSTKTPSRLPRRSTVLEDEGPNGESLLFCRRSGSSQDTPRQAKAFTDEGELIDPATGEVIPRKTSTTTGATTSKEIG